MPSTSLHVGKLECTLAGPVVLLASLQVKRFLAKKTFGNSCVYVMSTLCNILLLIFLFMSDGSESSIYWNWSCSKIILSRHQDSYLAFSPWICLWALLILVSKSRGLTILIWLIFLLSAPGTFQIILTHCGWNTKEKFSR